jgi:hypothetical protein
MLHKRDTLQNRAAHFVSQAVAKFGSKFDYSLVAYKNNNTPVSIICPLHGEFQQRPQNHIDSKEGCFQCGKDRAGKNHKLSMYEFVSRANDIHNNAYRYDKVVYVDSFTHITIVCPIHGDFTMQPNDHLYHKAGCKHCNAASKLSVGEQRIADMLANAGVDYIAQYTFDDLRAVDGKNKLRYDFYIPSTNTLVEFDGPHHFAPVSYDGCDAKALHTHDRTQLYDTTKNDYAKAHNINLIRIKYTDDIKTKLSTVTSRM